MATPEFVDFFKFGPGGKPQRRCKSSSKRYGDNLADYPPVLMRPCVLPQTPADIDLANVRKTAEAQRVFTVLLKMTSRDGNESPISKGDTHFKHSNNLIPVDHGTFLLDFCTGAFAPFVEEQASKKLRPCRIVQAEALQPLVRWSRPLLVLHAAPRARSEAN